MSSDRIHDVVVYGATGYVGRLVAAHLAEHAPAGTRVALGGRSRPRLEEVRAGLPAAASAWPLVVADAADPQAVAAMAASTGVVATTVGPYLTYGEALVQACAEQGTHYADLTGEVLFARRTVDRCHELARSSGARLVLSCGYDSIPSDLGVLLLHRLVEADGAGDLGDTVLVARVRGGFSGGTIDSFRQQVDAVAVDPSLARVVEDPYGLSPDRAAEPDLGDERDPRWARMDARAGGWLAPFPLGPYNARVVRRSNALLGWAYGRTLRYEERTATGRGPLGAVAGAGASVAVGAFAAGMARSPVRALLDRVLPSPGTGPSEASRRRGWFRSDIWTTTTAGADYHARVAGRGDPGYAATAVMMGESALALALEGGRLADAAGVLTPATGIGPVLVERLVAAGLELVAEPA